MVTLRREWSGPFDLEKAVTLEQVEALARTPEVEGLLLPLEAATFVANLFRGRGVGLDSGMMILCGAHQPPRPLTAPTRLEVDMGPLGAAEITLE